MNYINQLELIKVILNGSQVDQNYLLSTVDRQKVLKYLYKKQHSLIDLGKFIITNQPIEEENWAKIPKIDQERIIKLYEKLKETSANVINELIEYKTKYPNVPTIYNYLCLAYQKAKQTDKYKELLIETVKKFPEYLFGKISLSEYYINNNDYKKIPELLENKFEITQHYKSIPIVYHKSTVRGFYYITGRYFAIVGNIEMAYKSYFLLFDMDNKHETTEILGNAILGYEISLLIKKISKKNKPRELKNKRKMY